MHVLTVYVHVIYLLTFRYHVSFCCYFLIFDINCGVCWKDKFLLEKTVLNITGSSTPCRRRGTFLSLGLGIQWNVCLCEFMFVDQTLNSVVVSTLYVLYETKLLEIKKMKSKPCVVIFDLLDKQYRCHQLSCSCHSKMCSKRENFLLTQCKIFNYPSPQETLNHCL